MASCDVRTKNPTFSEVAVALQRNRGMEDVSAAAVNRAALQRGVPIKDCRLVSARHCAAIYFHLAIERGILVPDGRGSVTTPDRLENS